jgi:1-piperideine-2-carboxylate/1-pyrroline-2-carboxylate reductase [NAD(P)H]
MKMSHYRAFDAHSTAKLLPYAALVQTLRETMVEYAAGGIVSPERLVIPLQEGGVMLSMPSSADDLAIHKLVNVCPTNSARQLPTIHGQVVAYDSHTGEPLFMLDGPTVTGRRTAAVTALGINTLLETAPRQIHLIGTGKQAANHVEALAALFPDADLMVTGTSDASTRRFVESHVSAAPRLRAHAGMTPDTANVVIAVTTSKTPVYTEAAKPGRLVIGVGAFTPDAAEIGKQTVDSSFVIVDDLAGAKHEAGDLIQAGIDWSHVSSLAQVINGGDRPRTPVFFKSVGCAAWDLAACRVARRLIGK